MEELNGSIDLSTLDIAGYVSHKMIFDHFCHTFESSLISVKVSVSRFALPTVDKSDSVINCLSSLEVDSKYQSVIGVMEEEKLVSLFFLDDIFLAISEPTEVNLMDPIQEFLDKLYENSSESCFDRINIIEANNDHMEVSKIISDLYESPENIIIFKVQGELFYVSEKNVFEFLGLSFRDN